MRNIKPHTTIKIAWKTRKCAAGVHSIVGIDGKGTKPKYASAIMKIAFEIASCLPPGQGPHAEQHARPARPGRPPAREGERGRGRVRAHAPGHGLRAVPQGRRTLHRRALPVVPSWATHNHSAHASPGSTRGGAAPPAASPT